MANISDAINMSFRVDRELKKQADSLFKNLGLNTSVALNMFLTQSVREQAIPFTTTMEPNKPNKKLIKALKEAEKIEKGIIKAKRYNNIDELFGDLENEI